MVIDSLKKLFDRDLDKLKNELSSYKDELKLWEVKKNIKNSGGNLSLHIIGNLNYFIGSILGSNGYKRDREAEFTKTNVPVSVLLQNIDNVKTIKRSILCLLVHFFVLINYIFCEKLI